jgi:hypothetical protein
MIRLAAMIALLCLALPLRAGATAMPGFAVQVRGESLRQYRPSPDAPGVLDDAVKASVRSVGDGEWELKLEVKRGPVTAVWFPWEGESTTATADAHDVVYYPHLFGVAERMASLAPWSWKGGAYPGYSFAPLVVVAGDHRARMVAATNWPPRRVSPLYSLGRIGLSYDEPLDAGARRSYRALVVEASSDAGGVAWPQAVDAYKTWLGGQLRTAALEPAYPGWMSSTQGWLNVQLENMPTWDPQRIQSVWDRFKDRLSWVQFWGQMSAYAVANGIRSGDTGCCLEVTEVHERYEPDLTRLAGTIAKEGHVGFYARPRSPFRPLVESSSGSATPEFTFLRGWLDRNRGIYGANAFYIDVLGGRYFGEPLDVARRLRGEIDPATVVEYAVDVYPAAFLVSGALGGGDWSGGPGRTPATLDGSRTRTTFPALGRYLFDDRIIFLGESNGDGRWWGAAGDYWTERQAFLLGAKFDVIHPTENGEPDGPEDQALALAIQARDRARWWKRSLAYRDRMGLTGIPADVDVRRYRDHDGGDVLVVDNWHGHRELSVEVDGRPQTLPDDRLSIVDVPSRS